jgi:hypothetical protein
LWLLLIGRCLAGAEVSMARIVYCHPSQSKYDYHVFTDLDFWDARRLLKDLLTVKRNFGQSPPGDEFPTQIVATGLPRRVIKEVERRLARAIVSPPRHVIVRSMVMDGFFEFDPARYYPERWSDDLKLHFTNKRLPLDQAVLTNAYQRVQISWKNKMIRVERVQRSEKYQPVIRTTREAQRYAHKPSCF